MSFVYLGGDDTTKPTYFEVLAADKLVPSLRAAVVYTISVLSQRTPWLHRVLQYEDELLAALMLLVDWHSLSTCDATFAEGLYGLKRKPMSHDVSSGRKRISQRQRILGLLFQVGLPYVESKLERLYKLHADRGVLGLALRGATSSSSPGAGHDRGMQEIDQTERAPLRDRLSSACLRAFVAAYPWVQSSCQGLGFIYQLSYLLGPLPVHRPVLHALGMQMARVSAQDLEHMAKDKAAYRQAQLARVAAPPGAGLGRRAAAAGGRSALWALHLLSDHHRNALILAVFGFKALEWWYTSAEGRLAVSKVLPPPPPPPPPVPSASGVGLPEDPSLCPVCSYIMDRGCCPVTGMPATLDHIRKLYEGT